MTIPQTNGSPPPLPLLTREGKLWIVVTLGLFVTGLYKGINLLLLLSYMLMGLWFVNWSLVRRSMRITALREWRTPVLAGQATDWRVVLQNDTPEMLRGFQVSEDIGDKPAFWTVDRLSPHSRVYLRETVTFETRGLHPVGHLRIITRFPFGLVQKAIDLPGDCEVLVLPRLGHVRLEAFKKWLARASRGEGKTRQRQPLQTSKQADLHGLRQFRPGDSMRWIDWKSSARRSELIVREFENDAPPKLILIVEAWLPAEATAADCQRLEEILSLAGTLCRDWCIDQSSLLRLIVLEKDQQSRRIAGGAEQAWSLIELLAPLHGLPEPAKLDLESLGRSRRLTDAVLVLSSNPRGRLVGEIERLYRRPVAAIRSPAGFDWYSPPG